MILETTVLLDQINKLKAKMGELWDEKGETDPEILVLSIQIDRLLNQYSHLKTSVKN